MRMSETPGREPPVRRDQNDFEERLFAMIDAGELDFPKGAVRPGAEAAPAMGLFAALRARLARGGHGFPRLFFAAAASYGIVFVAALPVYRALFPATVAPSRPPAALPPVASAPPALGNARLLALGGGPTRASGRGLRVEIGASDSFLVLSFLVPIRGAPGVVHAATIREAGGRVVAVRQPIQSVDDLGNFVLACDAALFSAGDYQLVVTEAPSPSADPAEGHRFSFQVIRPRP